MHDDATPYSVMMKKFTPTVSTITGKTLLTAVETGKIIPIRQDDALSSDEVKRVVNVVHALDEILQKASDGIRTDTRKDFDWMQQRLLRLASYMPPGEN